MAVDAEKTNSVLGSVNNIQSKNSHTMKIEEVDSLPDKDNINDYEECIDEIYTPGALKSKQDSAEANPSTNSSFTDLDARAPKRKGTFEESDHSKITKAGEVSQKWHKVSIVDSSDDDNVRDVIEGMRRIDVVDETETETESDGEGERLASEKKDQQYAKCEDSRKLKEEGNSAMKRGKYSDAVKFYTLALRANQDTTFAATVHSNKSMAYIRLQDWKNSVASATSCLEIEPSNTKALYRRGFAKMMQQNHEGALADFQYALRNNPPKEQLNGLLKKEEECRKLLSSTKESSRKKKRHHDTQALAF